MCHLCKMWLNNCGDVCQSPLLHHLNDAEHENVTLRNDVHVGKTALECTHCGSSNDLVVGFASVDSNSVAVVLSKQTIDIEQPTKWFNDQLLAGGNFPSGKIDEPCNRQWKQLTDDVHFLSFMVNVPGAASKKPQSENRVCVTHTSTVVNGIQNSSENQDSIVQPQPIPSRFTNGTEYANFFNALLKLESDFTKNLVESMRKQVNITLRWDDLPNRKVRAYFIMEYDEAVWKLALGGKLRLRRIGNGSNWTGVGRVVKLPQNYDEEVGLEMETSVDIPRNHTTGYSVSHVWISTSHDREVSALQKFAVESLNNQNFLYKQILGTYVENNITSLFELNNFKLHTLSSLPPLSAQQENVVKRAIQHRLTLIQGPSASGKTVTLLSILYHLVQQNKGPILVCAHTNTVVDHLALSIHQMKLKVVRLFAETRPSDGSPTQFLSLESKIRNQLPTEFRKLQRSFDEGEELSSKEAKRFRDWKKMAERNTLDGAEVICCTCIAAGDERLSPSKFHAILIDESMQATEPECIIPISLGCEHLVLVGDHFQLNPVIKCKEALKTGLNQSLFKRLVSIGVQPLLLTVQYRMHPKLWHFPSIHYTGSLPSGVSAVQRKLPDQVLPWPVSDFPFIFYDVRSFEERTWPVKSYMNRAEASRVEQIVTSLLIRGILPDRIGIITQYGGQKKYLMLHMEEHGKLDTDRYRKIEVNTVDAFQGREKDIIIMSCVRSLGTTGVGSLNYFPRFHLVLTRAKYGLIIVGNSKALSKQQMWKDLLIFCQQHGVLVEGELDNLKPSCVKLS